MALEAGTTLGPYRIDAPLGAGGMGEVYKATDTRLDRTVAIKVLPAELASDPERRERFEREAKTISSLNHPHICTLYEFDSEDGIDFLVLEHLEGETLQDRRQKGALPLDQALKYAIEIADALDKAHRQGIVHRDLKPGNIMLTKAGAKLLDFGLAKLRVPTAGTSSLTVSQSLTGEGKILGTLPYMAPEQLEGWDVDARTDLFAFGAIVYEMVTGQRAFQGESQPSLITAIMSVDPPLLVEQQPLAPPFLDHLIRRCLAKDPDERWQAAADVMRELRWLSDVGTSATVSVPASKRPSLMNWGAWGLVALLLAVVTSQFALQVNRSSPGVEPAHLAIPMPPGTRLWVPRNDAPSVAISPDGAKVAYVVQDGVARQIYVRTLSQPDARPVPGTEGGKGPVFSPDGESLSFMSGNRSELRRVSLSGGGTVALCRVSQIRGISWGRDDTIIFASASGSGLWRVSAQGGSCESLTTRNEEERSHRFPTFLGDENLALLTVGLRQLETWDEAAVDLLRLDSGERRRVAEGGTGPRYSPTGHLLYGKQGAIYAVAFDAPSGDVTGQPVEVMRGVMTSPTGGEAQFALSETGTLVYAPGAPFGVQRRLLWVDRTGQEQPVVEDRDAFLGPRLSPDGLYLTYILDYPRNDVWVYDLTRGALSKVTAQRPNIINNNSLWTPDSRRVTFRSSSPSSPSTIFWQVADGSAAAEQLTEAESSAHTPYAWSPDGEILAFTTNQDIWILHHSENTIEALLAGPYAESGPAFSPDGRWLAYTSNETGRSEVYVRPFPNVVDGKWPISTGGGTQPRWARESGELFYREGSKVMVVAVRTSPVFSAATPVPVFDKPATAGPFDVTADGQHFVMVDESEEPRPTQINVVLNWGEGLLERVPVP